MGAHKANRAAPRLSSWWLGAVRVQVVFRARQVLQFVGDVVRAGPDDAHFFFNDAHTLVNKFWDGQGCAG